MGMAELINKLNDFVVIWEANNGKELVQNMKTCPIPEIILLDVAMPEMDGFESAIWLKNNYPGIKILTLSMFNQEDDILKMLKLGVHGYILKDADPIELKTALNDLKEKGYFYSDLVNGAITKSMKGVYVKKDIEKLNDQEIKFLKLVCSEFTYQEIADKMYVSLRTIDGYRDELFNKLGVKTRVGLVLYAIKNGYVKF
jgi:DNA-binding NarL/FixJ family response regulator